MTTARICECEVLRLLGTLAEHLNHYMKRTERYWRRWQPEYILNNSVTCHTEMLMRSGITPIVLMSAV